MPVQALDEGRYEVIEVPMTTRPPRAAKAIIPSRGLVLGWPEAGQSNVYEAFADGTFWRSTQSIPEVDSVVVATENVLLAWTWGPGFSSIYIDGEGEPSVVTTGSAPRTDYTDLNNMMNWTYYQGELLMWGHRPWPNDSVMEFWKAPVSAGGVIGAWTLVGSHAGYTSDFTDRGGTPRLTAEPNMNMFVYGTGDGRTMILDLNNPTGTPTIQNPPPGTDAATNKYSFLNAYSYLRGPLMDRVLLHRNNLSQIRPVEEWEWDGSLFQVKSRFVPPLSDYEGVLAASEMQFPNWKMVPVDSDGLIGAGVVIGMSEILDYDWDSRGAVIYTDLFGEGRQRFLVSPDDHPVRAITLYALPVGETALAHSYEVGPDGDYTNRLNEQILIIRPIPSQLTGKLGPIGRVFR